MTLNTHKNMIARDVAFVSTDVDGKHDSNAIVIDIGLYVAQFSGGGNMGDKTGIHTFSSSDNWYGAADRKPSILFSSDKTHANNFACRPSAVSWLRFRHKHSKSMGHSPTRRHPLHRVAQDEASSSTHSTELHQPHC